MKNLFKTSIMRKCLVFGVVLILTLTTFPMYAFADDDPGDSAPGDRYATEEELQDLDSDLHSTAEALYSIVSLSDTRATEKTVTDIYNWLNSYFGTSFQNQGSTYPSLVYTRVEQIRQLCTTINTSCNALVVKLTQFYNSINPDYETVGISIYDQLSAIATALTSVDSTDGDLTIVEILLYMHSELEDINTNLSSILNSSYSIDNQLVSILSYLVNFRSDMNTGINTINTSVNTGFTNVNANMALIISRLQSMHNDFNNVVWSDYTNSYLGFTHSITDISYTTGTFNPSTYPSGYFVFSNPALNGNYIFKFVVPVRSSYSSNCNDFVTNIQMVTSSGVIVPGKYFISYDIQRQYLNIYAYDFVPFYSSSRNINIFVEFNTPYIISDSAYFSYLRDDTIDYYTAYQYLTNKNQNNILSKFETIYASDDLIAAKQDQQGYEDQAIEDFTGSGSAAASGSDLTDMKSISRSIKSGLQSGGSVNNALAPFNTNSGFWGWFSQSNYDNINNIPTIRLRSFNNSESEIIDFYSNNQYTLQGLLNGGGN